MEKSITLKPGKEVFVKRQHPWVFSGAIAQTSKGISEGDRVVVLSSTQERLATGHYQEGSIRVRIIQHGAATLGADFWEQALGRALESRKLMQLVEGADTNAYRLVHGAGDLLPGLVVDIYNQLAVVQCHSTGMFLEREAIATALRKVLAHRINTIYLRAEATLPQRFAQEATDGLLWGDQPIQVVAENGHKFRIDAVTGQKTGFFLDQRENRQLLAHYAPGKTVLNTFCYTGGFSIYALQAGAAHVDSVDVSAKAMALTDENVLLNDLEVARHTSHTSDVVQFLRQLDGKQYDIVVVDPPAYAKTIGKRHAAVQGYKRLNAQAMQAVKPGGLLFTFSCSQVVDRQLFADTIVAAGLEAGRSARILHQLTQGPDHPVNLFHPEGAYLKGLVVQLD
ncbi:MAG: class I SAM-dependent rRNA methyltransferase [Saprospiraceae bacterium]